MNVAGPTGETNSAKEEQKKRKERCFTRGAECKDKDCFEHNLLLILQMWWWGMKVTTLQFSKIC